MRQLDSYDEDTPSSDYADFMLKQISAAAEDNPEYQQKMKTIYVSNEGMTRNNIQHELMIKCRTNLKEELDELFQ